MGRAEDLFARISSSGESAIDELIIERRSEELFLDFKRSSDCGAGSHLSGDDRKNLGKAISGFGNSEGGVVIWGVDCRHGQVGDVASREVKIQNPRRFKSWLEGAVSGLTVPSHPHVRHIVIEDGEGMGLVVTHVPKSLLAPHQCLRPMQYYMRVGSNFEPVPHGVLAGMFGRVPQPVIFHMWQAPVAQLIEGRTAQFRIGLLLTNRSPTIARDVYLTVTIVPPGGSNAIGAEFPNLRDWPANQMFGCITQILSREGFRLAPLVIVQPLVLAFSLAPPFSKDLSLKIVTGCSGTPIKKFAHKVTPEQLQALYNDFVDQHDQEEACREFVHQIVGGPTDSDEAGDQPGDAFAL